MKQPAFTFARDEVLAPPAPPSAPPRTAPYVASSATSRAAAHAIEDGPLPDLEQQVYDALAKYSVMSCRGLTDEECQDVTGLAGSTQRPRRVRLVERGRVVASGITRKTRAGRSAVVWRVS